MPETPPPATSSPTASPEPEDIDQAASHTPPPAAAEPAQARAIPVVLVSGNLQAVGDLAGRSWPSMAAAQTDSNGTPPASNAQDTTQTQPQTAQQAQQPQQQAQAIQPNQTQGNVLQASPAAPRRLETFHTARTVSRETDGRFGSPRSKSDKVSFLKPGPVTTYDDKGDEPLAPKGGISGLDAIPKGWPELPDNASQGVELAWVQANRLKVVKEKPSGGYKVDLSKARTPAPSWAALSWLETSIRSYAKFVEVASKQASSGQDEAEFIRKERMAIGEIKALLAEMRAS